MFVNGFVKDFGIWAKGANDQFNMAYNKPPANYAEAVFNLLCPTVPAKFINEDFPGIKGIGELVEFDGERKYVGIDNYDNEVISVEHDLGVRIKFRDLRADAKNLRKLQNLPTLLATQARKVKFAKFAAFIAANPTFMPTGKAFFADDHDFGDNNIGVSGLSSATDPSVADVHKIIEAAWTAVGGWVDDHGNPLNEVTSEGTKLIFVSRVGYENAFRRARNQQLLGILPAADAAAAIDNINRDVFEHWCTPRIGTGNVVYAFFVENRDAQGQEMGQSAPFVRTVFTDYMLDVPGQSPDDPIFRNNKAIEIGVYGDEGFGGLDASRALKITLTT
jgi:hypothetical protein